MTVNDMDTPLQHADDAPALIEETLRREMAAELDMPVARLDVHASLLELGLDSMRLMAWLHRLRQRGHKVKLRDLYQNPTLAGWSRLLRAASAVTPPVAPPAPVAASTSSTAWPPDGDAPFALTPVQHAYLVGRSPRQTLGGVGCHLYQEFDGEGLEAGTLARAVNALVERHPMLTAIFLEDGYQRYSPDTRRRELTVHDLRLASPPERKAHARAIRERLGHRVLAVERGENFDIQLTLLPAGRHRLHVNVDLLALDAASFCRMFDELAALARGERLPPMRADYDFRRYLAQAARENETARTQARQFWMARLEQLPDPPRLPLARAPEQIQRVRVSRRRVEIQADDWARFKARASAHGVTPTMALVTCFGAVLSRWSGQSRLLLNLTLFDRQPFDPAVEEMIADFTNILLLDIAGEGAPFHTLAQANQQTFADAHEHRCWSGVELLRELRRTPGRCPHGAPVVFTSTLGRPLFGRDATRTLGAPGWGISQTPQVWIDHLAYEHGASVFLQWDCNEALFPPGLLDAMFGAYTRLVRRLLAQPRAWLDDTPDLMPEEQKATRARANAQGDDTPPPEGLLQDGFLRRALEHPDALALIHGERRLTYGALAEQASRCAGALAARGVRPGDRVAIILPKGMGQIIAALGILCAGAVYVPVSLDQPPARRRLICQGADIALALVCQDADADAADADVAEGVATLDWREALRHDPLSAPRAVDHRSPAYIIHTSGSTGAPKGVVISHRGALNTCADINRRCAVTANDRVLALSALHFDLSVYDIFGLLSAGGALVLVDERQRRDPAAWCEAIERHGVTLWNTVPALFDMLLTYCEGFGQPVPAALRVAMLSGDWIGLDLPARYRAFRPEGRFVAMGGATEAAIWSNFQEVETPPPDWRSIPYGYPLARQKYRVVDTRGRDCPDWTPGELWIGGEGVALGYFNDPERTARQFVTVAGERWYRTGDMGCHWPDGRLEFLGRRDRQVKIGGHRVELGEIEAALLRVEGVRSAAALAVGEREKSLAAFVTLQGTALCSPLPVERARPSHYADLAPRPKMSPKTRQGAPDPEADMARLVADFLFDHLRLSGVDFAAGITADAAARQYGAQPRWVGLIERWLRHLVASGRLRRAADGGYAPTPAADPAAWSPPDGHPLRETADALRSHHDPLARILRGEQPAQHLLDHPFWAPERLLLAAPGMAESLGTLADVTRALARKLGRPVRLHEAGARGGLAALRLLRRLEGVDVEYTAWDESQGMTLRAQANLSVFPGVTARRWRDDTPREALHLADVVWLNNTLHRLGDAGARWALALAAPAALVFVHELGRASCLALVSAELLAEDGTPGVAARLREVSYWQSMLAAHGLRGEASGLAGDAQWLILRAPDEVLIPDPGKLSAALRERLPDYMTPKRLFFLDALPLTANGKVDHHALARRCEGSPQAAATPGREAPQGEMEQTVAALWRDLLGVCDLYRDSHFFRLGGDSLSATRLIGEMNRRGYAAGLGDLFDFPTLAAFAARARRDDAGNVVLRHDPAARYAPFALTDVQQAYLAGRQPGFALGGVGSHFFVEFEVDDLEVERFERAMNQLIARHDMLRAIVRDGMQQVLESTPRFVLRCHRVADLDGEDCVALRERLARQVLEPSRWPVFDIQAARAQGRRARLFVCLDNLMLDGLSMQILLTELEQRYMDPNFAPPELEIGFRDYLEHTRQQDVDEASRAYWTRRLESLPPAPRLPLRRDPADVGTPRFARMSSHLSAARWNTLKAQAREEGVTPSVLLLAAYATTLSAWAARDDMCLNLALFDRRPLHPQIGQVLGDFTTLLLLAWQPADDWRGSVHQLWRRLRQDLPHRDVSGIQVMRQIAGRVGQASAAMPVVFTSALGLGRDGFLSSAAWMKPCWGLSQTPQVWLDHQVYESEGELRFNWDYVQELFEPEQARGMFDQYTALLWRLAEERAAWDLPLEALAPRPEGARRAEGAPAMPETLPKRDETRADDALVQALCQHFSQVVGVSIQPRQSFFEAGATSLKLVQLHARLTRSGYDDLSVIDLFAHTTPVALAARLQDTRQEARQEARAPSTTRDALIVASEAATIDEARRRRLAQRRARAQRRHGEAL
jgi:yersiniabactin nonribosomal peptide synthetase